MSTPTWLARTTTLVASLGTTLGVLLLAAAPAVMSTGCTQLECATGTIEENGVCVPSDSNPTAASCGAGTVLGDDGTCVAEWPPTMCGPNTIEDTETVPGLTVCTGTGGVASCESFLPCPGASANKVTVCGRLYDIENDQQLRATDPTFLGCEDGGVAAGPCQLKVTFYDALDFAGNPSGASPLTVESFTLDDCGRYVARNINRPSLGFLGIGVDDANGAPDLHRNTGVAFPVSSAQVRNRQKTYVIKRSTDEAWSAAVSFGASTFIDRGVYMALFLHGENPVSGVTVTANGAVRAADDYYFTDTEQLIRRTPNASGPTGANGAALMLNSGLVEHSGTGAEPSGCVWPSDLAASIPGVLFFSQRHAQVNANTECP